MGRNAICCGLAFAVIGFVFGLYTLSWGSMSNLPLPLVLILCPAALLGSLAPSAELDTDFMWLLMALNAILYGAIGILLANLLHLDKESKK
jgi:hypothetical protein